MPSAKEIVQAETATQTALVEQLTDLQVLAQVGPYRGEEGHLAVAELRMNASAHARRAASLMGGRRFSTRNRQRAQAEWMQARNLIFTAAICERYGVDTIADVADELQIDMAEVIGV